jgi:hypothetical protein
MPTVIHVRGWRLFFYANESNEPPHVHCRKGDAECKYWLGINEFDIRLAYEYDMTAAQRREIRRIIFGNFDLLVSEYKRFQKRAQ